MARDFAGVTNNLSSADNAVTGLDNNSQSFAGWVRLSADSGASNVIFNTMTQAGAGNARFTIRTISPGTAGFRIGVVQTYTVTTGRWSYATDLNLNQRYHVAVTLDASSSSNNPIITIDGTDVSVSTTTTPSGSRTGGDDTIRFGEDANGGSDYDGILQGFSGAGAVIWSAGEKNRQRFWGRARGVDVIGFPFFTSKLADEGTATGFSLTDNSTAMAAFATPTVRPGSALLGMGIGW